MLLKKNEKSSVLLVAGVILAVGLILVFLFVRMNQDSPGDGATDKGPTEPAAPTSSVEKAVNVDEEGVVKGDIVIMPTIDYHDLKKNKKLRELMITRKEGLGITKSLDMIVRSDETFKVGDIEVSMRDILEKAFLEKGDVFEETIASSGAVLPQKIKEYGIYVVQPGDNIWNIHFNILKEYYDREGIHVSPKADEPIDQGMSSGVGKILKFSETIVIIYNLVENKVDTNIDLLEPLSKIVVYNLEEVFSLLREVNYENIDRIQFDGKTIWFPAKKS